ncbi:MAG: hypothetical protein ACRCVJ_12330 [Clostridium sp.]|uniref:hypothetical protein n=1 Tax=Clostridium sp. TaxID=1506 RepID=UPI003F340DBC
MQEYALYQGDEFIDIGTIEELANKLKIKESALNYYTTGAYKRKVKRRGSKNARILVKV